MTLVRMILAGLLLLLGSLATDVGGALVLPAHAGSWQFQKAYKVEKASAAGRPRSIRSTVEGEAWRGVYSGLKAAAIQRNEQAAEVDLYFGIRPSLLGFDMDINYNRRFTDAQGGCCATVALNFDRPLWLGGTLTGRFTLDPDTLQAATETRATFRVLEKYDLNSTVRTRFSADHPSAAPVVRFNFLALRRFENDDGSNTQVGIRFGDTSDASASAALTLNYRMEF